MDNQGRERLSALFWLCIYVGAMIFWGILSYLLIRLVVFLGVPEKHALEIVPLALLTVPILIGSIVLIIVKASKKKGFGNL